MSNKIALTPKLIQQFDQCRSYNMSLLVKPGRKLRTVSPQKSVLLELEVDEPFNQEIAIFDISRIIRIGKKLTGKRSKYSDQTFQIKDGEILLQAKDATGNQIDFHFRGIARENIIFPPNKKVQLPSIDLEFELTAEQLEGQLHAGNNLQLPDIVFSADDENSGFVIGLAANIPPALYFPGDPSDGSRTVAPHISPHPFYRGSYPIWGKDDFARAYKVPASKSVYEHFEVVFRLENLKLPSAERYRIQVCAKGISFWEGFDQNQRRVFKTYIATETSSFFGNRPRPTL